MPRPAPVPARPPSPPADGFGLPGDGARRWPVVLMLLAGTAAAAALAWAEDPAAGELKFRLGARRWAAIAALAAVAAVPPVSRAILAGAHRVLGPPSARRRALTAVGLAAAAAVYLAATAHLQGRDLFPKTHDEQSYLIQMQMLARGRLWMDAHPLHDFFDTFYVLVAPKYASFYFPGTALMYVPHVPLGLPTWVLPACAAGACVGLVYRLIAEAVDPATGLLAALGLLASGVFRVFSVLMTSHVPMLLLGLSAVWAWTRWRQSTGRARLGWAAGVGAFTGWAAITRPADAVCYAVPIGVAILLDAWRCPAADPPAADGLPRRGPAGGPGGWARRVVLTGSLIVAGAAPFLSLQLVFNRGVTGQWFRTPYTYYLNRDQPNNAYGFQPYDPAARPRSRVQQKQDFYDAFYAPYVRRHQPDQFLTWWGTSYLHLLADATLPTRAAVPLVFVGLLAVAADRRRAVVAGVLPVFLAVFIPNTFFFKHYAIDAAPAVLVLAVLGVDRLAAAWPRRRASVWAGLSAGWAVACLLVLPEFNPLWPDRHRLGDETFVSPFMRAAKVELPTAADLRRPAVVLFTYRTGDPMDAEPVYNTDVAWPDDAPVIVAHDLGPARNPEIFRYYADRQPDRVFYRWDRRSGQIDELGTARDLAR